MKFSIKDILTYGGIVVGFAVQWGVLKAQSQETANQVKDLVDVKPAISRIEAKLDAVDKRQNSLQVDIRELRSLMLKPVPR